MPYSLTDTAVTGRGLRLELGHSKELLRARVAGWLHTPMLMEPREFRGGSSGDEARKSGGVGGSTSQQQVV